MIAKKNLTGIILAGGKSSRMGTDKGFLKLNDKLFIQHCIDALEPIVSKIIIVSDNIAYDRFKYKRIEDKIKNSGPLAGIYSGLKESKTTNNLILSCDIPLINSKVLKKLIQANDEISEVIQIKSKGKIMPLIALYKKSCETPFLKFLNEGEKRLQYAVNQCHVKTISLLIEEELATTNINTKEQLKQIKACF